MISFSCEKESVIVLHLVIHQQEHKYSALN